MLQFKSLEDLQQLSPDSPSYPLVAEMVQRLIVDYAAEGWNYDPAADGWVSLWEEADGNRPVEEIWEDTRLTDLYWEGVTMQDGHYLAIYLPNNQAGYLFIVPNQPWLDPKLRECLEYHLDPAPAD